MIENHRHGGPFDRGRADSYYQRERSPHYYPVPSYHGDRITDLTDEEVAEYHAGYDWNQAQGEFKSWD